LRTRNERDGANSFDRSGGRRGRHAPRRPALAQPPAEGDIKELVMAMQNPVGDLTSLPFQFNFNTGRRPGRSDVLHLNFQPVIPFKAGNWNVIARTIVPLSAMAVDWGQGTLSHAGPSSRIQAQMTGNVEPLLPSRRCRFGSESHRVAAAADYA